MLERKFTKIGGQLANGPTPQQAAVVLEPVAHVPQAWDVNLHPALAVALRQRLT